MEWKKANKQYGYMDCILLNNSPYTVKVFVLDQVDRELTDFVSLTVPTIFKQIKSSRLKRVHSLGRLLCVNIYTYQVHFKWMWIFFYLKEIIIFY
ncbi:hypothetical protein BK120_00175 [Paenibacillus sp. FSL A5-0031]|nr:hypothetical protein BK120_00175 [Paenibacillus sp. FSL A5-0031]